MQRQPPDRRRKKIILVIINEGGRKPFCIPQLPMSILLLSRTVHTNGWNLPIKAYYVLNCT